MRLFLASLLLASLLACAGPRSGIYTFLVEDEVTDCPDDFVPPMDPGGDQTITVSSDEIVLEGNPSQTCALDGMDFFCEFADVDEEVDYADQGLDAVYIVDVNMDGEWITGTTMEGIMEMDLSCEGTDCAQLARAGAPSCSITWDWTAEK